MNGFCRPFFLLVNKIKRKRYPTASAQADRSPEKRVGRCAYCPPLSPTAVWFSFCFEVRILV